MHLEFFLQLPAHDMLLMLAASKDGYVSFDIGVSLNLSQNKKRSELIFVNIWTTLDLVQIPNCCR